MKVHLKAVQAVSGLLAVTSLVVFATSPATAAEKKKQGLVQEFSGQGYGMGGCGLGSILFGEQPGMVQIFASTTNDIYSNNTFAVTSGTSNCEASSTDSKSAQLFIESNHLAMQNDVARGSGETLSAFYDIAGCDSRGEVSQTLQKNYQTIFATGAGDEAILKTIRQTLRANEATAQACPRLG